ncbi:winged helix/forkhead transcription factor [Lithospermum erythrorhizon]|uniref:Winged helix/forkhead transcription factor n=1 Tax=Lithospermum erythrorhizon TaxID=34254 RepID=A0AAV3RDE9_LITER
MGEVVLSRSEMVVKDTDMKTEDLASVEVEKKGVDGGSTSAASSRVVKWERFLPNMVLRVLLVEADDSTRQIITALLRKCSYRVAAVSDGLKAWEVLRERSHNIDLILTEVDLPSISGFALLTLIMEHENCKNIPVIMMSAKDSVSTVYKCMLRGAADFLVKPVRKNELGNLWQHVWRRQASSGSAHGPVDESVAQPKVEATAENNATSNHSSGYMACVQRNRERIDKGSDAQSSCTKPEIDAEEADVECTREHLQPKENKSVSSDTNMSQHECATASKDSHMHDEQPVGLQVATTRDDCDTTGNVDDHCQQINFVSETPDSHAGASPREAIDLIGAFNNYLKCSYQSPAPNMGVNKTDSSPLLDLSLRRSNPSGSVNQDTDERPKLNRSDASAFTRYVNRTLEPQPSTSPNTCNQQKDYATYSDKQMSLDYNSDARAHTISQNYFPLSISQPGQSEITYCIPEKRVIQAPIPLRGIRFENLGNSHGPAIPQTFCMQSGSLPGQRPGLASHQQASTQANVIHARPMDQEPGNLEQSNCWMENTGNDVTDQSDSRQEHKLETLDDRGYFSSATDQSTNSSFGNGTASHFHSINYGSNCKVNAFPGMNDMLQYPSNNVNSHRAMQREAALNKFRLKRKERCYDKKVRYESRKKLAEQRPRVKGQFVRQVHNDAPAGSSGD